MKKTAFLLPLLLAGCVTMEQQVANQTPPTPAMKAQIVEGARNYMADPYSIRDAEISDVWLHPTYNDPMVCVRGNAKNALGGYTGRQAHLVAFTRTGSLSNLFQNSPLCTNPKLRWQPFPEIYKLRNL